MDEAQLAVATHIERYYQELYIYNNKVNFFNLRYLSKILNLSKSLYVKKFFQLSSNPSNNQLRGIYIWGTVGSGKSYLVECFFKNILNLKKIAKLALKIHFYEFMSQVHFDLVRLYGYKNPIEILTKKMSGKYRLICLDEFHVNDIADAMILYKLLHGLIFNGVQLIITSNYHPNNLYLDGLNRQRFLPAIELLNQNLDILQMDYGIDYRQNFNKITSNNVNKIDAKYIQTYITPINENSLQTLEAIFEKLSKNQNKFFSKEFAIDQIKLKAFRITDKAAWFTFHELCESYLAPNNYLNLVKKFRIIIISAVPQMRSGTPSAQRFTWLVDILYEQKIILILEATTHISQLYFDRNDGHYECARTLSRLTEMQSILYFQNSVLYHT